MWSWSRAAAGLLLVSLLILLWAKTRPGFDPYGWLVWGRQTVAGNLNTNAAPSWKPLPYLFTAPYGLFGHYQLWLWMVTSLAVSLAGAVFAGRIAYRLTARGSERRYAAFAAAAFAAARLLRDQHVLALHAERPVGPDDRDAVPGGDRLPSVRALPLGVRARRAGGARPAGGVAVPRAVLDLGVADGPFDALADRRPGSSLVVLLWFGIPALTSRTPFVAASNALGSGRRLRSDQVFGTIGRFLD